MTYADFQDAILSLGFDPEKLILEFATGGANNNVLGLNYEGTPWAVCIYFPKTENIEEKKLQSYQRLEKVAAYLTKLFKEGRQIDENNRFLFDGNCILCNPESTKEFLQQLAEKQSFKLPDMIYTGPFLVKKGAPSSETLEYDLAFRERMIESLAILHRETGRQRLVDKEIVLKIVEVLENYLDKTARRDLPSEVLSLTEKFEKKWKINDNSQREFIIREMLLRSDSSITKFLQDLIIKYESDSSDYNCFIHGDAHGANFIVVRKGTKSEVHPIDIEDATGITEDEKAHYLFDVIKFAVSAHNLSEIFGKPISAQKIIDEYYAAA
ncbi:MAG: hypothetical protein ACP5N3_01375 [Candidatus Nanoarchaeia archaeon]